MHIRLSLLFFLLLNLIYIHPSSPIQNGRQPLLIPIGGDYLNITPTTDAAIANAKNGIVNILVLPIAMASNPTSISESERRDLLDKSEAIRTKIQQDCQQNAPKSLICNSILAEILTRSDAHNPKALNYFNNLLSEIFILDGDPTTAMEVIGGTQVELSLDRAYQSGVVIAGTGAGSIIQSVSMMSGYHAGYSATNSLEFNAPDVWTSAEKHGLLFGLQSAIIDVDFFKDNHFGRLLNAITLPDATPIGIGIDTNTAAYFPASMKIEKVSGSGTVTILDAATYHADSSVKYVGARHLLSIRNVIVNVLAPGNFSYDIRTNSSSLASPVSLLKRSFGALRLPTGSGQLWLAGDLQKSQNENLILDRFIKASGGAQANILIVACGYPSETLAQSSAIEYVQALKANSRIYIIHQDVIPRELLSGFTGILLLGGDQSRIEPDKLVPIKNMWLNGTPLLAINAAAAVIGEYYDTESTVSTGLGQEPEIFPQDKESNVQPGLGLLKITVQSKIMDENKWASYLSLAASHADLVHIGLNDLAALELTQSSATALGENVVLVLDLRSAALAVGTNHAYVIANGLLDSYAPGDSIEPAAADSSKNIEHQPTPDLSTPTGTLSPSLTPLPTSTPHPSSTPTIEPTPTRRVKPSSTPLIIPPPSDPGTRSMMVAFGVLIAFLIAIGVWINRKRML